MHELSALFIAEAVDTFCDVLTEIIEDPNACEKTIDSAKVMVYIFQHPEVVEDLIRIFEMNEHKELKFRSLKDGTLSLLEVKLSKQAQIVLNILRKSRKRIAKSGSAITEIPSTTKH